MEIAVKANLLFPRAPAISPGHLPHGGECRCLHSGPHTVFIAALFIVVQTHEESP